MLDGAEAKGPRPQQHRQERICMELEEAMHPRDWPLKVATQGRLKVDYIRGKENSPGPTGHRAG